MYLALESLEPSMRARIDTMTVKNDTTYNAGGHLRAGFEPITDLRKSPGAVHPIIRTHPETSRNALNLGSSAEHTSEPQSLMRIPYAAFCLQKKTNNCNTPLHSI